MLNPISKLMFNLGVSMKKMLFVLLALSCVSAFAGVNEVEAKKACLLAKGIVPTATGLGISQEDCLSKFAFDEVYSNETFKIVLMVGETITDKTTVCEVSLLKDFTQEIMVARPTCRVEE